jgi:hypothetical protein
MKKLTDKDHEKFNQWIFSIDDSIEELVELGKKHGVVLNFSIDTPDKLEKLLLKLQTEKKDSHQLNIFGQYLGEFFRKTVGGSWKLDDDEGNMLTFNKPVIAGHNDVGYVFDPIEIIEIYVVRKKSGTIASAVDAERGVDDLNLVPEE